MDSQKKVRAEDAIEKYLNGIKDLLPPTPKLPEFPSKPYPQVGWTCPRCGRGNAPSTATCPCIPFPNTLPIT